MLNILLNQYVTISNLSSKLIRFERFTPKDADYQGYDIAYTDELWNVLTDLQKGSFLSLDKLLHVLPKDFYLILLKNRFLNRFYSIDSLDIEIIEKNETPEETFLEGETLPTTLWWSPSVYMRREGDHYLLDHPISLFKVKSRHLNLLTEIKDIPLYFRHILYQAGFLIHKGAYSPFTQDLVFDYVRMRRDIPHGSFLETKLEAKNKTDLETYVSRHTTRGHNQVQHISRKDLEDLVGSVFTNKLKAFVPYFGERYIQNWPSAGACYELTPFVLVHQSKDLGPDLYKFDISSGKLSPVQVSSGLDDILRWASNSWGHKYGLPQAVIVLASDMELFMKKYPHDALRLSLLNSGVAISKLYDEASKRDLGICALGSTLGFEWRKLGIKELNYTMAELAVGLK